MEAETVVTLPREGGDQEILEQVVGKRTILGTDYEVRHVVRYSPVRRDFTIVESLCNGGDDLTKRHSYTRVDTAAAAWQELTGERVRFTR